MKYHNFKKVRVPSTLTTIKQQSDHFQFTIKIAYKKIDDNGKLRYTMRCLIQSALQDILVEYAKRIGESTNETS